MNKSVLVLCAIMSAAFISGCSNSKKGSGDKIEFEDTEELVATDSSEIDQYGIYSIDRIVYDGDSIWIAVGEGSDSKLFLLDDAGRLVAKGVSEGKGRGEILGLTAMHKICGRMMLYDSNNGTLYRVLRKDSALNVVPLVGELRLLDDAALLADGRVVTMHIVGNYSYAIADTSGTVIDTLKYYPPKPDKASDFTNALAYTGRSAFALDGRRFARTCPYDGGIDFFGTDGGKLKHIVRQEEYPMCYDVIQQGQSVPTLSKSTPVGYRSLTASADVFYALFSKAKALEAPDGFNEVRSFSADGKPLCKYVLDRNVSDIVVSPDNSRMIAFSTAADGKTMMYRFVLPR